jgi:transposase
MTSIDWEVLMGGAIKVTRTDMSAKDLRCAAKRTKDGRVVRRLLAIALVLDGVDRETAARSSGMDRQTLRDWAHRFNAEGIEGLSDRNGKGAKPRLSPKQQAQFVAWVERVDVREGGQAIVGDVTHQTGGPQ